MPAWPDGAAQVATSSFARGVGVVPPRSPASVAGVEVVSIVRTDLLRQSRTPATEASSYQSRTSGVFERQEGSQAMIAATLVGLFYLMLWIEPKRGRARKVKP